jgi:excisionase family DNA binding protein
MSNSTEANLPPAARFVSAEELAKIMGVSVRTIRRWTKLGKISYLKAGSSAARYDPAEIISELKKERSA